MNALDTIRDKILKLYNKDPHIHINVSMNRPRVSLSNEPVVIKGVYPYIFQIEERSSGTPRSHALQYTDILMRQVEIVELAEG